MSKIYEPELNKNCGKCAWSTRDTTELKIKCCLGTNIENTWETAHNCNQYVSISQIKNKKRVPYRQLDLFIHQNL